jgi:hypothetical protein
VERSARLRKTVEILTDLRRQGEKALIFVEHRYMQDRFAQAVTTIFELEEWPLIINGAVPGPLRKKLVDRFSVRKCAFDLIILSPKAAGVGLNITAANHVVHLSRWWNPAVEDQCNDRVYRMGQKRPVTIHVPMAVHPVLATRFKFLTCLCYSHYYRLEEIGAAIRVANNGSKTMSRCGYRRPRRQQWHA